MSEKEIEKNKKFICKRCGSKMLKNGIRNDGQRWRCSNKNCKYTYAEKKYISKTKQQAINFLHNFIRMMDKKIGSKILQTNENLAQTSISKDQVTEIIVRDMDFKEGSIEIPSTSYIIYCKDNKIHLLNLRHQDKGLTLKYKNNHSKFEILKK
jgi:ribosomal protein L37AE/L43A